MFERCLHHRSPETRILDWTDKISQKKMNENLKENDKNSERKSK